MSQRGRRAPAFLSQPLHPTLSSLPSPSPPPIQVLTSTPLQQRLEWERRTAGGRAVKQQQSKGKRKKERSGLRFGWCRLFPAKLALRRSPRAVLCAEYASEGLRLPPSTKGSAISALPQYQPRSTCVASTARSQSRRKIVRRTIGWKRQFLGEKGKGRNSTIKCTMPI